MNINVRTAEWNESSARWLALSCSEFITLQDLEKSVIEGRASLFEIRLDGKHIGSFTASLEEGNVSEIVITGAGGHAPGINAYQVMTQVIEALAVQRGAKYVRGHTQVPAVGRMMQAAGFEISEMVYRKEVNCGR